MRLEASAGPSLALERCGSPAWRRGRWALVALAAVEAVRQSPGHSGHREKDGAAQWEGAVAPLSAVEQVRSAERPLERRSRALLEQLARPFLRSRPTRNQTWTRCR